MNVSIPAYSVFPEPALSFHPERSEDRDAHPLRGLIRYGPYSRSFSGQLDPIRVATIAPSQDQRRLSSFLTELTQPCQPQERHDYLIDWPGFERVFRLRVTRAAQGCHIGLADDLNRLHDTPRPHLVLARALSRALTVLQTRRADFDVVFVYLPDRWSDGFTGDVDDFDLHDFLKAITAEQDLPSQILREGSALAYPCRASVMWRVGTALYVKAGGVPWKLATFDPETAHIGLSYAIKPRIESSPQYVTCCSQVFDADGTGLEFIAYDTSDAVISRENPFLTRTEMARLMARSLSLYQRRHAGTSPRRIVVQKNSEFKKEEIDGCFDAFEPVTEKIELLQVQQSSGWRGVQIDPPMSGSPKGQAAAFPLSRGTCLPLGTREILLWTQGTQAGIAERGRRYYKEGRTIPEPLKLVRFAGHGPLSEPARDVLGLTKMNWNNDGPHDRLPVTLSYAHVLARTIKRFATLASRPYQFRFFM